MLHLQHFSCRAFLLIYRQRAPGEQTCPPISQAVSTKIFISCPVGPFKIWSALWRRLLSRREEAKQGIPFWPLNSDQMLVWILVNKPRNGGRNASWVSCCLVTCLLRCLCHSMIQSRRYRLWPIHPSQLFWNIKNKRVLFTRAHSWRSKQKRKQTKNKSRTRSKEIIVKKKPANIL